MDYRISELFAEKTYAASYVEKIDINLSEIISGIMIRYETYNSAAGSMDGHFAKTISKVELVAGSDVLLSLTGQQLEALDFFETGVNRNPWNAALNTNYADRCIMIHFGRYLGDELIGLDPNMFKNLQLQVSITLGVGGITCNSVKMGVNAWIFDDFIVNPIGFLMTKEIKSWLLDASAHEYTEMPLDFPYRKIFMQQQELGKEPFQNIDLVKFSEDNDKKIIMNMDADYITSMLRLSAPMFVEHFYGTAGTAQILYMCTPTSKVSAQVTGWAEAVTANDYAAYDGDGGQLKVIADTGTANVQVHVQGFCPHGVFPIPCFAKDEPGHYYDVTRINKSLKADIRNTSSPAGTETAQIFVQQLRKY